MSLDDQIVIPASIEYGNGGGGGAINTTDLADWPAGLTTTELGYVNGVTESIQTQLNTKIENFISNDGSYIQSAKIETSNAPDIVHTVTFESIVSGNLGVEGVTVRHENYDYKISYVSDFGGQAGNLLHLQADKGKSASSEADTACGIQLYNNGHKSTGPWAKLRALPGAPADNSTSIESEFTIDQIYAASYIIMDNGGNGVRVNLVNGVISLADPCPGLTKAAHYVLSGSPTTDQIGVYNQDFLGDGYLTIKWGSGKVGALLRAQRDFVFII